MSIPVPVTPVALDEAWRPSAWNRRVLTAAPARWPVELGVVSLLVAYNIAGSLLRPEALYVPANLAVAALLVVLALRSGATGAELGLDPGRVRRGLAVGLVAAALVAVVLALAALGPGRGVLDDAEVAAMPASDVTYRAVLRIPAGTAILEEVAFRGVLLALLLRRRPVGRAVVVSSALFGLWHITPAAENASGHGSLAAVGIVAGTVLVTTAAGIGFAWLRLRGASLVAPVLAHWATNSAALVAAAYVTDVIP